MSAFPTRQDDGARLISAPHLQQRDTNLTGGLIAEGDTVTVTYNAEDGTATGLTMTGTVVKGNQHCNHSGNLQGHILLLDVPDEPADERDTDFVKVRTDRFNGYYRPVWVPDFLPEHPRCRIYGVKARIERTTPTDPEPDTPSFLAGDGDE